MFLCPALRIALPGGVLRDSSLEGATIMVGLVTHILFAIVFLSIVPEDTFEDEKFILGVAFPNICYEYGIDRSRMHFSNVSLKDIYSKESSFGAGVFFHGFVNRWRTWYMRNCVDEKRFCYCVRSRPGIPGAYSYVPKTKKIAGSIVPKSDYCLKFSEDTHLWRKFFFVIGNIDWGMIADCLWKLNVFEEELLCAQKLGLRKEHIVAWRKKIKDYFLYPDINTVELFIKNSVTKNLKEQAHLIRIAHNVMSDKRLKKIAYDFFYDFYFFMDEEVRNIIKSKKKVR